MKTLFTLLALVGFALAQAPANYDRVRPVVTLDATTDSVLVSGNGYGTAGFQITGTWAGTIRFSGTINGTDWVGMPGINAQTRASDTTATENGIYFVGTSGAKYIKAKFTTYTSGSATVNAITTDDALASSSAGGGGAAGTVDVLSIAAGNNNIGNVDIITMPTVTVNAHAVTNAGTFATQAAQSGTWTVQPGNTANTTAWKVDGSAVTQPVSVASIPSHAVTNAGTFATQLDGAALTSLQLTDNLVLAEDAAHASADPGLQALAVRRDANTTLATSDGDYGPLQLDAAGSLKVAITAGAGSGGTSIADDAAFTIGSTSTTPVSGVYNSVLDNVNDGDAGALAMTANRSLRVHMVDAAGAALSVGGGTQYAEDVASTDGQIGTIAMAIRKATPANQSGTDGDLEPMQVSAGRLWTSSTIDAALPAGTNAIGKLAANSGVDIGDVDVATIAAGDNNIGNVDVVTMPTITVNAHAVTNAGTFAAQAAGAAAHDAAASGGPVQTGGVAQTADPTVVTAGDAAYSLHTIGAKQVVMPYSISGSRWSYAAASGGIVNTTAVTVKAAAAAGIKNCITSVQVINAHATVSTETLILDGAAGTVLHRGWAQAAGGGYAHEFPVPICGTAATLIEVDNVTTGAAVYYNLQGYISAE